MERERKHKKCEHSMVKLEKCDFRSTEYIIQLVAA